MGVSPLRLAFVVQRYGLEVCGGGELLARSVAERLAKYFEIHVVTTCALEYMPWDNFYPEGNGELNGVKVHRFRVDQKRSHLAFDALTRKVFSERHDLDDELRWARMIGPDSSGLLEYIRVSQEYFDLFFFFTYHYSTTFFGLQLVPEKAVLLPLAPDDRYIYLEVFRPIFLTPRALVFLTDAERSLVQWRFKNSLVPSIVVGTGVNAPTEVNPNAFRQKYNLDGPFIVYVGRVDPNKGCSTLFKYFQKYKAESGRDLRLVVMGKVEMAVPSDPDIVSLGFVAEEDKFNGIVASTLMVLPSEYESLSIANLEAWSMGVPVLANGYCQVLKENSLRSNGGLYYTSYEEFAECLDLLLSNAELCRKLGENGRRFVEGNYSWEVVEGKYRQLIADLTQPKALLGRPSH